MAQADPNQELFDTSKTFADLGLSEKVVDGLTATGFKHPTGIQAALIPPIIAGKDVIGQAKTGTGKTAAFGWGRPPTSAPASSSAASRRATSKRAWPKAVTWWSARPAA